MAADESTDRELTVVHVPIEGVCHAWQAGAHELSRSLQSCPQGTTPDLLKNILMRGEQWLFAIVEDIKPVGWFTASVFNETLRRTFYIHHAVGPGCTTEGVIKQTKAIARAQGCTHISCSTSIDALKKRYEELGFKFECYNLSMGA
jgi:hypothetical protein